MLKKRIKLEHIGLIGFGFITCVVNAQAQSVVGTSDEAAASRKPRVTVALMLSGGEGSLSDGQYKRRVYGNVSESHQEQRPYPHPEAHRQISPMYNAIFLRQLKLPDHRVALVFRRTTGARFRYPLSADRII